MNDPIDVQGMWWLPESPAHKVPGWLRYNVHDGGELRLSGSLRPPEWIVNERDGKIVQRYIAGPTDEQRIYPRIHGQSGRRLFHLEDCFQTSIAHRLCREDDSAERVHVNWLLTGAWFDGEGQVEFDKAIVRYQHLTDWVGHSGLETDYFNPDPSAPFARATARSLPAFRATIQEGCDLLVWQELSTDGDGRNDLILNQRWTLTLSATGTRALDFFTDRVRDFQDLLTIATGTIANIDNFDFTHHDVPLTNLGGEPVGQIQERLGYHSRWSHRDENRDRLNPHAMVFTFDDVGGIEGVRRWMQFANSYRSELSRVMATRYNNHMFLEDRVTNCVAALESFDRTRRGAPHGTTILRERLRECVEFAGFPFTDLLGEESVDDWTARAKNHRNTLDHHLDAFRNDTGIVERELGEQLFWLAALCFLRAADAPDIVFERARRHSTFRWLAHRVKANQQAHHEH